MRARGIPEYAACLEQFLELLFTDTCLNLCTHTYWEKNRNFFDFLSHGVEIKFSNFGFSQFVEVESFLSSNETLDEIDSQGTMENSALVQTRMFYDK